MKLIKKLSVAAIATLAVSTPAQAGLLDGIWTALGGTKVPDPVVQSGGTKVPDPSSSEQRGGTKVPDPKNG